MNFKKIILMTAIYSALSAPAIASSEIETLIKMLHTNGTVNDAQYDRLMKEIQSNSEKEISEKEHVQAQLDKATNIELKMNKGGMQLATKDGEFNVKLGGRVQVDAAWYDEDGAQMGNGTEIRRARFYLQGTIFTDWGYKLQYDFTGSGRGGIKDAFISYNGFDNIELKVGNFKDPFMLQEQTSSKHITFTERSLMDTFATGRHIGAMVSSKQKHWTAAVGVFGDTVNTSSKGKDEGWSIAGRATFSPINEKTRVIHLGAAVNYRETGDRESLRFKQQPETHISGINMVDTGTLFGAASDLKLGAEFAAVEGPFSAQAEYIWTTVKRESATDLNFDGWYVEAAYFLTGESRPYKKGKFAGVSPNSIVGRNGIGAWQLAARYSAIDLNDANISGGEAESFTVGLNWYPTPTLRFSANYITVIDIEGGAHDEEEPRLAQVRGQWAF